MAKPAGLGPGRSDETPPLDALLRGIRLHASNRRGGARPPAANAAGTGARGTATPPTSGDGDESGESATGGAAAAAPAAAHGARIGVWPGGADGALPPVRAAHGRLGGGAAPFAAAVGAAAPRVWAARPSKWRLEKQTSAARAKPSASAVRINDSTSWLILFTVAFQWGVPPRRRAERRSGAAPL